MRVLASFDSRQSDLCGGGDRGIRRCDTLYELAMQKNDKLERKRAMIIEESLKGELEELTFRPKTNRSKQQ